MGKSFLSTLMYDVYKLLSIKKVNTTAYHPQTDGVMERFNCTLTSMLVKGSGKDLDELHSFCILNQYARVYKGIICLSVVWKGCSTAY